MSYKNYKINSSPPLQAKAEAEAWNSSAHSFYLELFKFLVSEFGMFTHLNLFAFPFSFYRCRLNMDGVRWWILKQWALLLARWHPASRSGFLTCQNLKLSFLLEPLTILWSQSTRRYAFSLICANFAATVGTKTLCSHLLSKNKHFAQARFLYVLFVPSWHAVCQGDPFMPFILMESAHVHCSTAACIVP